jgi:C-terminal processing protease CtpA/Prc
LQVFEEVWGVVNENYLYADFNGLDWNAVHEEYNQRIQAGMSNAEFYNALDGMISRLGDEHSSYFSPQEAAELDAEFAGEYDYVGIGVLSGAVPERSRVTVLIVFPGSPAERAGIQPHDSILAVDGQPVINADGIRTNLLRGPEGTTITVTVQSPGEEPRQVQITRHRIEGGLPVPYDIFTTPEGKRIG